MIEISSINNVLAHNKDPHAIKYEQCLTVRLEPI